MTINITRSESAMTDAACRRSKIATHRLARKAGKAIVKRRAMLSGKQRGGVPSTCLPLNRFKGSTDSNLSFAEPDYDDRSIGISRPCRLSHQRSQFAGRGSRQTRMRLISDSMVCREQRNAQVCSRAAGREQQVLGRSLALKRTRDLRAKSLPPSR